MKPRTEAQQHYLDRTHREVTSDIAHARLRQLNSTNTQSWWITSSREEFSQRAKAEAGRMAESKFGGASSATHGKFEK